MIFVARETRMGKIAGGFGAFGNLESTLRRRRIGGRGERMLRLWAVLVAVNLCESGLKLGDRARGGATRRGACMI